jgi:hypothetical protein
MAGDLLRRWRRHHGCYCAPHAVEMSRSLRARAPMDVWFTVIRSEQCHRV